MVFIMPVVLGFLKHYNNRKILLACVTFLDKFNDTI